MDDFVTWWRPEGYTHEPAPAAWHKFAADTDSDFETGLNAVGYRQKTVARDDDGEIPSLELEAYIHTDGHLVVILSDINGTISQIFIHALSVDVFFFEKWPMFLQTVAAARLAEGANIRTKALLAFVRHGHGEHVISECGTATLDDDRRARAARAARAQAERLAKHSA